jgi:hypothetical protein
MYIWQENGVIRRKIILFTLEHLEGKSWRPFGRSSVDISRLYSRSCEVSVLRVVTDSLPCRGASIQLSFRFESFETVENAAHVSAVSQVMEVMEEDGCGSGFEPVIDAKVSGSTARQHSWHSGSDVLEGNGMKSRPSVERAEGVNSALKLGGGLEVLDSILSRKWPKSREGQPGLVFLVAAGALEFGWTCNDMRDSFCEALRELEFVTCLSIFKILGHPSGGKWQRLLDMTLMSAVSRVAAGVEAQMNRFVSGGMGGQAGRDIRWAINETLIAISAVDVTKTLKPVFQRALIAVIDALIGQKIFDGVRGVNAESAVEWIRIAPECLVVTREVATVILMSREICADPCIIARLAPHLSAAQCFFLMTNVRPRKATRLLDVSAFISAFDIDPTIPPEVIEPLVEEDYSKIDIDVSNWSDVWLSREDLADAPWLAKHVSRAEFDVGRRRDRVIIAKL